MESQYTYFARGLFLREFIFSPRKQEHKTTISKESFMMWKTYYCLSEGWWVFSTAISFILGVCSLYFILYYSKNIRRVSKALCGGDSPFPSYFNRPWGSSQAVACMVQEIQGKPIVSVRVYKNELCAKLVWDTGVFSMFLLFSHLCLYSLISFIFDQASNPSANPGQCSSFGCKWNLL